MTVNAELADRLAKRLYPHPEVFKYLRDHVDVRTGSDLECFELDLLTEMVEVRLRKKLAAG
ncbi:hypothetical protein PX52LOC_06370 [Limnoglobus roseus]|uniref:Uncharacterized protein n=1 Tax=Limnoglobus roseus TaxID=2598579 RepID=A0A5C1AL03_9BACT|nr:hypothetical protein PX52LOC_06370 [Limnoglobus roseus]